MKQEKGGIRIGPVGTGDKYADDGTPWLTQNCPTAGAPVTEQLMTIHFLPPKTDLYDAAVEDAIATCNGDLRGCAEGAADRE